MKISKNDYDFMSEFLFKESGMDLGDDKEYLLLSRLGSLLTERKINDFCELTEILKNNSSDYIKKIVIDSMTTHETLFFRDDGVFEAFRTRLLPEVLFHKQNKNLNIWSAACSTGQESYSIAMMVLDTLIQSDEWNLSISGTDLSRGVLERAKKGVYSDFEIKRGINEDYLGRYFKNSSQGWEVNSNLKEIVTFSEFNLIGEHGWYSNFDFIFCRNVLIYFPWELKIQVLRKLASSLRTGGYLILGGAESNYELNSSLEKIHEDLPVYKKV